MSSANLRTSADIERTAHSLLFMFARLTNRQSSFFAMSAWLCLALHLSVFSASVWHFHTPHEHSPFSANSHDAASAAIPTSGEHSSDHAPLNGRDPDGCSLCQVLYLLGHTVVLPPMVFAEYLQEVPSNTLPQPIVIRFAACRQPCARGPPVPARARNLTIKPHSLLSAASSALVPLCRGRFLAFVRPYSIFIDISKSETFLP